MPVRFKSKYYVKTEIDSEKATYTFELAKDHYLTEVFNELPSNAIINKGRCGIGGTFLEINNKNRNSIIVVPTNAIIDNKCFTDEGNLKPNHYVVRGKVIDFKPQLLKDFMNGAGYKKIFCTPESLSKIVKSGFPLTELYTKWFILFDETHTAITEAYRKRMLDAFKFAFNFTNKAFISATPFRFSAPELKTFDVYDIQFSERLDLIEVMSTKNVNACLHFMLTNPNMFPNRVHIFLNSVNGIADAIRMANLDDCSIFCKDDKENQDKLDEVRVYFKDKPIEDAFSKFNFYTTKYFEGWDLWDENATMIIVSDYYSLTLKTGISNKCVQAVGRNRKKSNRIIHITNDRSFEEFKSFDQLQADLFYTANDVINHYNSHLIKTKEVELKMDDHIKDSIDKYAESEQTTGIATLNHYKVDRLINVDYCNQEYNHVNFIKEAWENAHYSVIVNEIKIPVIPEFNKNLKESLKVQKVVEFLDSLKKERNGSFRSYSSLEHSLPIDLSYIVEYYDEIGGEVMMKEQYNMSKLRKYFVRSRNEKAMKKVAFDLYNIIGNQPIETDSLKEHLLDLYKRHNVFDENYASDRTPKVNANKIKSLFSFVTQTKLNDKHAWRIDAL